MGKYTGTDNLEVMAAAENYNRFLSEIIQRHAIAGDRIVDFGAGIGTFAKRMSAKGYQVECVEPDAEQVTMIRGAALVAHTTLDAIENDSVDYLYSLNVLEHIEDDREVLEKIYRKLKPGGVLLIYVPAFQILFSSMDRKVGHFRRYTRSGLSSVARAVNLQIVEVAYADSIGFFVTLLYKLIGDDSGAVNSRALVIYDRLVFPLSRAADKLFGNFFGKNVLLVAQK